MNKILITGSAGLLGSSCAKLFTEKGWEVVGIDNNARSANLGTPRKILEKNGLNEKARTGDITNENDIKLIFENDKFDAIVHCAGQASHDFSNENVLLDFDTNARGTVILLEATRKYCPEAVFVHVSTDKVYGENMGKVGKLADETLGLDFVRHRSPFGCSKTAGDIYAQEYAITFGLKTGIFRPGCITGKNHEGTQLHGFLAYLAKCIREGKLYKIFGYEGKQVRDQIHADDLANAFWHFIQNPRPGEVYNIGGGLERAMSLIEFASLIEKEIGGKFIYEFAEGRLGDREWDIHDVSKFRSHYPLWDYKYSLADIIKDVCSKEI